MEKLRTVIIEHLITSLTRHEKCRSGSKFHKVL